MNRPNYSSGNRHEISYLIHNLGLLPYPAMQLVKNNINELNRMQLAARKMENDGVLERHKMRAKYGNQFLTFKDYDKNKTTLTSHIDKACIDNYINNHQRKLYLTWGASNMDGMRKILTAYIGSFIYASNIDIFPDQDKGVNKYYTSQEIKRYSHFKTDIDIKDAKQRISFSKAFGMAVTEGGNYLTYMAWHNEIPGFTTGEYKFRNTAHETLLKLEADNPTPEALLLMKDAHGIKKYICTDITPYNSERLLRFKDLYASPYILPFSREGRKHMEIMCTPLWKERLLKTVFGDVQDTKLANVVCHHYDKATKTASLLFCIPNLSMLSDFYMSAALANDKKKFRIICFDYQYEYLKDIVGDMCELYTTPLDDYYNKVIGG